MKTCTVCGIVKEENDYFFRDKRTLRLHSQCKQCYVEKRKAKWKEYYHKHGSKYRENAVSRNRLLKIKLRAKMLEYLKDKSCVKCGFDDIRALYFDHIDPSTKMFSIARAIGNVKSWDEIMIEVNKCQLLCANCHKIKTSHEQRWYRNESPIDSLLS